MSRLNIQNLRDFFVNYIGNSAFGAMTHVGETIADHRTGGTEGVIRSLEHGNVIFAVAYADQDLAVQLLEQLTGGPGLGNALGVDIDDPGTGKRKKLLLKRPTLKMQRDFIPNTFSML